MTEGPIDGIVVVPTPEDLIYIREKLRQAKLEFSDVDKRIMFVIKHNGVVSGCIAARLVFQIEPLYLTPEFLKDAPPITVRRAVFKLCKSICAWLGDRTQNRTGISWTFAFIPKSKEMQEYVQEYGFIPVYKRGKFYARDF